MEQLLNRTDLLEFPVIFFQNGFILVIKPVSFAAAYRLHGLCIQLAVVYRHVRIDGGSHFHTYKTAAGPRGLLPGLLDFGLPLLSVSRSLWLLVPMNEAYRLISWILLP